MLNIVKNIAKHFSFKKVIKILSQMKNKKVLIIGDTILDEYVYVDGLGKPSKESMYKMANEVFTTATDFADYLVKEKKLSFRQSYIVSSKLVNYAEKNNKTLDKLSLIDLRALPLL